MSMLPDGQRVSESISGRQAVACVDVSFLICMSVLTMKSAYFLTDQARSGRRGERLQKGRET